jgi:hypothetical protein
LTNDNQALSGFSPKCFYLFLLSGYAKIALDLHPYVELGQKKVWKVGPYRKPEPPRLI